MSTSVRDPEKASPSPALSLPEKEHSVSIHNDIHAFSKKIVATPVMLEPRSSEQAAPPPALDWDDEHDPDNPHNWSASKRAYNTFVPGLLGLAITFGSSIYTPSYHEIAERYHISSVAALVPLSVWTFGLGFGPMLGAPLSEMHGRKIVYMISTPLSLLFTMGAGLSNNFAGLCLCRFFGAFFGSPILAVGAGTIADIYPPRDRAQGAASFVASPFLGPALGPFVGGFAVMNKGYRWTNWAELMVLGAAGILSLFLSESYKKIILRRRAVRRGIEMPPAPRPPAKVLVQLLLLRPLSMLALEPIVQSFSLYVAFAFAVLFAFFAAFPLVFTGVYHMNPGESGMAFFGVGIGVLLGVASAIIGDRLIYRKKLDAAAANGTLPLPPEERLFPAMVGSLGLPIGLFWFAWTSRADVHWISPIIASVFFGWGNFMIFISAATYLQDTYGPMLGASAMAANGLLRYTFGAAFPLFTLQMYQKLGIGGATSLFGGISVLMLPIPWILYKWGPALRAKSRYSMASEQKN